MERWLETHPWITFDLRPNLTAADWMNFGEARSKCQHLSGVPIKPKVAETLAGITLKKGALATTAIEGNTVTFAELEGHLSGESKIPRSREYQMVEVTNVLRALNEVDAALRSARKLDLTPDRILRVNRQLTENTEHEVEHVPGEFRRHNVTVGNVYKAPEWHEVPDLVARMCRWLSEPLQVDLPDNDDGVIARALIRAVAAHIYLAWIHPFGDGNGRTARLVEVQILSQAGVPLVATNLLSDHYNKTRDRYYRELVLAGRPGGRLNSFLSYAVEGFVDGLREQIASVTAHQVEIAWQSHVHEVIDGNTPASRRQRHLLLDMPLAQSVPRSRMAEVSVRVAQAYARAGERTLPRDLNSLVKGGLLIKLGHAYMANISVILGRFIPTFPAGN